MKNSKLFVSLLSLFLLSGVLSCKVEGPTGPAGADGIDGNANVKSQIITVNPSDWQGDGFGYEVQKAASIVTQDIVDSGFVLSYLKVGTRYYSIPSSTWNVQESDNEYFVWTRHFILSHSLGAVQFAIQDDDGATAPPNTAQTFKIVAVSSSQLVAGIDLTNYDKVAEALELKD